MTDNVKFMELVNEYTKQGKVVIIPPSTTVTSTIVQNFDFETERRKDVIQRICTDIANKRVPLVLVSDWTRKTEDYCRRKITRRSNYTHTVWAVDALQFVCNEWQMPVPECCEVQLQKFRRQDEKKKNGVAAA